MCCLGAPLARLEAEVALGRLLERLPCLRLSGDPIEWGGSVLGRSIRHVPLIFN